MEVVSAIDPRKWRGIGEDVVGGWVGLLAGKEEERGVYVLGYRMLLRLKFLGRSNRVSSVFASVVSCFRHSSSHSKIRFLAFFMLRTRS